MIRFLFRFLGFWLLAGGFVALVADGTRSIAASALEFTSAGDAWFMVVPDSLTAFEASGRSALPGLWDHVAAPLLSLPAFLLLGGLGLLLLAIGRVRERSRFELA